MKTLGKRLIVLAMAFMMVFGCVTKPVSVSAYTAAENLVELEELICAGKITQNGTKASNDFKAPHDFSEKTYKTKEGGYVAYTTLVGTQNASTIKLSPQFEELTTGQQQQFIKDMMSVAYDAADEYAPVHVKNTTTNQYEIDDSTIDEWMQLLSNASGMGSSMLAALMADVKPNYASANNIFKPFSGVIGTILALLSIIVMALVGVTMAMDICYITIPAFQLAMNGDGDGGDGKGKSKIGGIISADAKAACSEKDNGNCTSKEALGKYFKTRVFGLCLLGICLLYLVNGQIYTFVSWLINLMSGFLGF